MASIKLPTLLTLHIRLDCDNFMFWRSQVLTPVKTRDFEHLLTCTTADVSSLFTVDECGVSMLNSDAHLWHQKDQFILS